MLYFYKKSYDYLKFTGTDRLDLINRLSTNEVKTLEKYKGIKTILTSDRGRFVDLITLYNFGDFVFVTCSFNNSSNVIRHLEKYTIMDDFNAENMTGSHETILVFGNDAEKYINGVFSLESNGLANNDFFIYSGEKKDALISRNVDTFGGYNFIYAAEDKDFYLNKTLENNLKDKYKIIELDDSEFETKRIEYGIPEFGKEMNEDTNPLECGLNKYISFTKGCYIGQEVIARLDTYDKISKHLIGVKADDRIPEPVSENPPKLIVDDKECGFVTSSANSGDFGYIGLGFVKTILLDYNKDYKVKSNGNTISCKITNLPFK